MGPAEDLSTECRDAVATREHDLATLWYAANMSAVACTKVPDNGVMQEGCWEGGGANMALGSLGHHLWRALWRTLEGTCPK